MKIHRLNPNDAFGKLRSICSLLAVAALMLGALSFASLLLLAPSAFAQKTSGTITGTVTDPSGAAVPGATVGLVSERTGAARQTVSNEQGSFSFPEVEPGIYTLTVNKGGFKKLTERNVELHVGDVTAVNLRMEMGAASETVTVEAAPIAVNTSTLTPARAEQLLARIEHETGLPAEDVVRSGATKLTNALLAARSAAVGA